MMESILQWASVLDKAESPHGFIARFWILFNVALVQRKSGENLAGIMAPKKSILAKCFCLGK